MLPSRTIFDQRFAYFECHLHGSIFRLRFGIILIVQSYIASVRSNTVALTIFRANVPPREESSVAHTEERTQSTSPRCSSSASSSSRLRSKRSSSTAAATIAKAPTAGTGGARKATRGPSGTAAGAAGAGAGTFKRRQRRGGSATPSARAISVLSQCSS